MRKNVEKETWKDKYCTEEELTKRIEYLAKYYRYRTYKLSKGRDYYEEDLRQEGWIGALKFLTKHPGQYYKAANHARAAMQLFCRVNSSMVGAYKTTDGIKSWNSGEKVGKEVSLQPRTQDHTGSEGSNSGPPVDFVDSGMNPEEWLLLTEAAVAFTKAAEKVGEENLPHFDRPGPRFSCKRMNDIRRAMEREIGDVWVEGLTR